MKIKLSDNFWVHEFYCPCDECKANRHANFKLMPEAFLGAQMVRDMANEHFRGFDFWVDIKSGFRCYNYNKKIGGDPYSIHQEGRAIDFDIIERTSGKQLAPELAVQFAFRVPFWDGIGLYDSHVHGGYRSSYKFWDWREAHKGRLITTGFETPYLENR